jgi:hypothetical protein
VDVQQQHKSFEPLFGFTEHEIRETYGPWQSACGADFVKDVDKTMEALKTWANGYRLRFDSDIALYNVVSVVGYITAQDRSRVITWAETGALSNDVFLKAIARGLATARRTETGTVVRSYDALMGPIPLSQFATAGTVIAFQAGYLTLARRYDAVVPPDTVELCAPNDDTRRFLESMFFMWLESGVSLSKVQAWVRALVTLNIDEIAAAGADLLHAVSVHESLAITNEASLRIVLAAPFVGSSVEFYSELDISEMDAAAEVAGYEAGTDSRRRADIVVSWREHGQHYMVVVELKFLRGAASERSGRKKAIEAVKQIERSDNDYFKTGHEMVKKLRRLRCRSDVTVPEKNRYGLALVAGTHSNCCQCMQ